MPVCRFLHSYGGAGRRRFIWACKVAAARNTAKYTALESRCIFQPIAVETLCPINGSAVSFLVGLGRRIADVSGNFVLFVIDLIFEIPWDHMLPIEG